MSRATPLAYSAGVREDRLAPDPREMHVVVVPAPGPVAQHRQVVMHRALPEPKNPSRSIPYER